MNIKLSNNISDAANHTRYFFVLDSTVGISKRTSATRNSPLTIWTSNESQYLKGGTCKAMFKGGLRGALIIGKLLYG